MSNNMFNDSIKNNNLLKNNNEINDLFTKILIKIEKKKHQNSVLRIKLKQIMDMLKILKKKLQS